MTTIVEGTGLARDDGVTTRQVTVAVSKLAFESLTGGRDDDAAATIRMESALRCYLGDEEADRPAWPYPDFLRGSELRRDVRIKLEVAEDLWRAFEEEAVRQDITVERLAEHAAFYFAAELNAGRVTQRILDDLEPDEGEAAS